MNVAQDSNARDHVTERELHHAVETARGHLRAAQALVNWAGSPGYAMCVLSVHMLGTLLGVLASGATGVARPTVESWCLSRTLDVLLTLRHLVSISNPADQWIAWVAEAVRALEPLFSAPKDLPS